MSRGRETVYDTIRMRIVSGEVQPGGHLAEAQISEELGVSRSPVRAALHRLAEEGLVRLEAHRGAFASAYTRADIEEVFELRRMLEGRAASLAALNRTSDHVARSEVLVQEMGRIVDARSDSRRQELHDNNRGFHELILSAANSPRLFQIVKTLTQTSVTPGTFFYYSEEDLTRSLRFHTDIHQAIADRRSETAEELMSLHLRYARDLFVDKHFA